jgi:hypothetical protein
MAPISNQLQQLCQSYGINTSYADMNGQNREASTEALQAVLQALGASVRRPDEITSAQRLKHMQDWQSVCPPVIVLWETSQPLKIGRAHV